MNVNTLKMTFGCLPYSDWKLSEFALVWRAKDPLNLGERKGGVTV